jgi:prepilin-type N-terminal cleavage/methylation domain-containing protein
VIRARLRAQAGYTLVELLTVLVIFTVVLTSLVALFVQGSTAQAELGSRFEAQQDARLALDKLRREIHCAKEAETSAGTGAAAEVTLRLPSHCPTSGGSPVDVRWCAVSVATNRYALYRTPGAPCNSTGVKWADYLTLASVFDFQVQDPTRRSRLRLELQVDTDTTDAVPAYALCDVIILRNSLRSTATSAMLGYTDTADLAPC